MAKDKSGKSDVTRIDLRIPNHIFEEIEKLATETNQPLHHITGKVITTPVILNLINLGLESVRKEDFGIEAIASKDSLKEAEIEKKILSSLILQLDEIIESKLNLKLKLPELTGTITDKLTVNSESQIIPNQAEVNEDKAKITDSLPVTLTDNKELEKDDSYEVNEDNLITDKVTIAPSEGLSSGKLAERFKTNKKKGEGASKTTINTNKSKLSKEEFINWSKKQDPEGKGWYYNENEGKFCLA